MSIQQAIEQKLSQQFEPQHLEVDNESHMHAVPANSETHFRVVLVSPAFGGKRKVARHQALYATLNEELSGGVHALTMHLYTPEEWAERQDEAPQSPLCKGGSKAG